MPDLHQRVSKEPTAVDVLRAARALIEKGWTQYDFARNSGGWGVDEWHHSAACFCSWGALNRAGIDLECNTASAIHWLRSATVGPIAVWNDAPGRTQAEVLAAFDKAIELAQSEASHV